MADDQDDILDTVLQQSQMVFFCIPYVGPFLAAGASIWGAVRHANKIPPRQTYSVELAIADLGNKIEESIKTTETRALLSNAKAWQIARNDKELAIRDAAHNLDASSVLVDFADFEPLKATGASRVWADLGDDETSLTRWIIPSLKPGDYTTMAGHVAPLSWADATQFAPSSNRRDLTIDDVKQLDLYCEAKTAYHAMCRTYLQWGGFAYGYPDWMEIDGPVRESFEHSLILAIDHLGWVLGTLKDTFDNMHANAHAVAKSKIGVPSTFDGDTLDAPYSLYYSHEIRRQRTAVFLDQTTPEKVDFYLEVLGIFGKTLQGLRIPENRATVNLANIAAPTGAGAAANPGAAPGTLGPRSANTVRFLYECDVNLSYIDVVANPTVLTSGNIATQNAGSAKPTLYYQLGGATLNLAFATQLGAAGQLDGINTVDLPKAYNAVYGAGEWEKDNVAVPTRQDRLTSVLVPLGDGDPVGDRVVAMIYSAAPELTATGLSDPAAAAQYRSLYATALGHIATWNTAHPKAPIVGLRVTMLSTGTNAGSARGPALNATAAGLIVDTAIGCVRASPALAGLTILVNNSDALGGAERLAFDLAAKAHKATNAGVVLAREGFDVPY
jgi:hypothetical protein